jgi:outer membrane protein OmpA-like peptidoglycan-associated protein
VREHIIDVIRRNSEDPEVEIARVVLLGLSSPEGAFEFNKRLSGKRAEALKQYIADRIALADSCFALVNGDEGWEELRYKWNTLI